MNVHREASRSRSTYRYPPLSTRAIHGLLAAYEEITNRTVWPTMKGLLFVCARIHGPDTMRLMLELYEDGGADDLLLRLKEHPPRETVAPLPTSVAESEAGVDDSNALDWTLEELNEVLGSATPVDRNLGSSRSQQGDR